MGFKISVKCKKCLHYEVCKDFKHNICQSCNDRHNEYRINENGICDFFKPCKIGDIENGERTLQQALRPCIVGETVKGLFHCWEQKADVIPPSPYVVGHNGGQFMGVYGLVELEDGTITKCYPEKIQFIDNLVKEMIESEVLNNG